MKVSLGEELVAALVRSGDSSEFVRLTSVEEFLKVHELEAYEKVKAHVRKHGVLPAISTAEDDLNLRIPEVPEPPSYYYDQLRERYVKLQLIKAWQHCNEELKGKPLEALAHFQDATFQLGLSATPNQIIRLQDAEDVIWPRYVAKVRENDQYGIRLGWPELDEMTGGLVGGDLISIVGRPAQGKTQMLAWAALNVNREQRRPVLFVSMEMRPELILERCVAVYTKVPLSEIRQQRGRRIPSARQARFKRELVELRHHDVPFWIVDGNLGKTVPDIYMLARQLKPAAIFIDGGYLVQHENERLQTNQRIAANCNMMKQMLATELDVATTVTWQINREGAKSKRKRGGDEDSLGLEHIAGSGAIEQDSSLICALMEEESPETILKRVARILKGRGGEQGEFTMAWDWEAMHFGSYVAPKVSTYGLKSKGEGDEEPGKEDPDDGE